MQSCLKRLIPAAVILLSLLAVSPSVRAQADEPWMFLRDFTVVPGAVSEIESGYVASVFRNTEKGLLALVIYPEVCDPSGCGVENPVAYFVVDTKGLLVKLHLNPGTKLSSLNTGFHIA
jgi:hypothetical protein